MVVVVVVPDLLVGAPHASLGHPPYGAGDLNAHPREEVHAVFSSFGYRSAYDSALGMQEPPITWPSGLVAPLMDQVRGPARNECPSCMCTRGLTRQLTCTHWHHQCCWQP